MGLISSGGMGGTDFARQTARNTQRTADYTGALLAHFGRATPQGRQPYVGNLP
jgi:hypothetical protein